MPTAGAAQAWRTWVAVDSDRLLGTASLERHGGAYLLRSVAVRDEARGRGIGAQLVRAALAAVDPAQSVALLTETAAGWFPRFGFHPVDRTVAPGFGRGIAHGGRLTQRGDQPPYEGWVLTLQRTSRSTVGVMSLTISNSARSVAARARECRALLRLP